jgi:CBS domain-containing protein
VRYVPSVGPGDDPGRAAELMRAEGVAVLPVAADGVFLGVVTEGDLQPGTQSLHAILRPHTPSAPVTLTADQALTLFDGQDLTALPVVDDAGAVLGVVRKADLVSVVRGHVRPLQVGGLATPVGVLLTGGGVRGGVSDLAVIGSGVVLAVCIKLAEWAMLGIAGVIQSHTSFPALAALHSPLVLALNWMDAASAGLRLLWILLFLLFVRWSPLSRYHGAEHQVVHAIERQIPLDVAHVRALPTVHPRCGTNLLVGLLAFAAASRLLAGTITVGAGTMGVGLFDFVFVGALIVIVLHWRSIGGFMQQWFTTRVPTPKQSQRAIDAGEEVLRRYRAGEGRTASGWEQVWNRGLLQVMIGAVAVTWILQQIESLVRLAF